jgi:FkbM family methyltransferase
VLRENVERNELHEVTLYQRAVAANPGSTEFYVNANEPGALNSGIYRTKDVSTAISIQADRLSDHIHAGVDLLKLDIEGAEEMVIRELAQQNKLRLVRSIVCEYHHHHHRDAEADRLSQTLLILEQAGFGYQLDAYYGRSRAQRIYQDVLLYAYRKESQ